jgi:hypothetical protein
MSGVAYPQDEDLKKEREIQHSARGRYRHHHPPLAQGEIGPEKNEENAWW